MPALHSRICHINPDHIHVYQELIIVVCNITKLKGLFFLKPIFHCDTKTFALDPHVGLYPQREISCWKYQHVCIEKMLKFALPPMRNPKGSQWNIGCVGPQTQNSHVHFILLVSISFAFGPVYGLKGQKPLHVP